MSVRASPFHARVAEANRDNVWSVRNGTTLGRHFGNSHDEALAARVSIMVADISSRCVAMLQGARAEECMTRALTRSPAALSNGQSLKALWLNDRGAVRGAGVVAREASDRFLVASTTEDGEWFSAAASLFDVSQQEPQGFDGGLALIGPYAGSLLNALGLPNNLEPAAFQRVEWRSSEVVLSRWGEHGGFEIWCRAEDAVTVWDRVVAAGRAFASKLGGSDAFDILDLEAGVARPERDYLTTREGDAESPTPGSLGLQHLIDAEHMTFNGREAFNRAAAREMRSLIGLVLHSDLPAGHVPLFAGSENVGRTLSSAYSPALRRAIALAQVDRAHARAGTMLTLTLPLAVGAERPAEIRATVVDLPFLELPVSIQV